MITKKSKVRWKNPLPHTQKRRNLLPYHTLFCMIIWQNVLYLYVQIHHLIFFYKMSKNSTPSRETTRAQPTPTPAGSGETSKVRHAQATARGEVDLSSSYLEDNSRPGLNRSLRLLSRNLWKIFPLFFGVGVGWQRHCKTCQSPRELDNQGTASFFFGGNHDVYLVRSFCAGWRAVTPHKGNGCIMQCEYGMYA